MCTYKCAYHRDTELRLPGDMPYLAPDNRLANCNRCTGLEFHSVYGQKNDLRKRGLNPEKLVSFKSVYMRIFYDFFIAQIQLLLMSTEQQKSFLCENGPPRSSSEHRGLFCGKSARYSFLIAVST